MSKVIVEGSVVSVHYRGTLNDGSQFDSSYDRGEPIGFTVGSGHMISGFEDNVLGMSTGEKKTIVLKPESAYGDRDDGRIQEINKSNFPPDFEFAEGAFVHGQTMSGEEILGKIVGEKEDDKVIIDFNHPLAGLELNFEIEVVGVQ